MGRVSSTFKVPDFFKVLFLFLLSLSGFSQVPSFEWAKSFSGSSVDAGSDVCVDNFGNVYVAGFFTSPTLVAGSFTLTNSAPGSKEIYLAKCDSAGNVLWALRAAGNSADQPLRVITDKTGNVYMTGYFQSATLQIGAAVLTNAYSSTWDVFVAKFNSSGNLLWAKRAGQGNNDEGLDIACDKRMNVYVTGNYYSSKIIFGSDTLLNSGRTDYFIVKYDSMGTEQWAQKVGGTDYEGGYGLAIDDADNVYAFGDYCSFMEVFGSYTLYNVDPGTNDMFLVKYDPSGRIIWAKSVNGPDNTNAWRLNVDPSANLILTGTLVGQYASFDSITVSGPTPSTITPCDLVIAKYDSAGHALWASSAGGNGGDIIEGLTVDAGGNAYITGIFSSTVLQFDAFALTNLSTTGAYNMFLTKYDPTGIVAWAKQVGGTQDEEGSGLASDPFGNLYCTGSFSSPQAFFDHDTLYPMGAHDAYLAKIAGGVSGIKELEKDGVRIYPNPSYGGNLTVNSESPIEKINAFNLLGESVTCGETKPGANQRDLHLENSENGVYFLEIRTARGITVQKVMIAKP